MKDEKNNQEVEAEPVAEQITEKASTGPEAEVQQSEGDAPEEAEKGSGKFSLGERKGARTKKKESKEESGDSAEEDEEEEDQETEQNDADYEHDDPLAPAYDLDRGALLDKQQGTGLPWRGNNIGTAKEFFNTELLYRYDILEVEERTQLLGRYRLELKGYQGGVWTLVLGDDVEVINRREDAEIVITMQQRDFLELVNGELNPQLAILGQKMKVHGDVRKAINFQQLLTPSVE